jgi:plasmid stabilization system protein ParE
LNRRISFHDAARDELREAARWYEREREGLGEEFLLAVQTAIERAARGELPGLAAPETSPPGTRRIFLQRFPYAVHFGMSQSEMFVWAVAHQRRRPGYWRTRR